MDALLHWAGFLGAWLLVAGPLLQASIELRGEQLDREGIEEVLVGLPQPERISAWWWLLPPVAYVKNRNRTNKQRMIMFAAMNPEQREQYVGFLDKARGWFSVAGGAFLIALKESWELVALYELPAWVFWVGVVVISIGVLTYTVLNVQRSEGVLHADDPEYEAKKRAERERAQERHQRMRDTEKKKKKGAASGE